MSIQLNDVPTEKRCILLLTVNLAEQIFVLKIECLDGCRSDERGWIWFKLLFQQSLIPLVEALSPTLLKYMGFTDCLKEI